MTRDDTRQLHRQLVSLYEARHRRHYIQSKLATDPLYNAVFNALKESPHPLLDIGCGMGLLAFYLRARGFEPPITGIDYDERKIEGAGSALKLSGQRDLTLIHCDARDTLPDFCGNITILDVLQFMPTEAQADLLQRCAASIAPGASLIIRSCLNEPGWRFGITRFGDAIAKWARWMKDAPNTYPTKQSLRDVLEAGGLEGTFTPLWGRTPFNNYLIVFRRPLVPRPGNPSTH